MDFLLDSWIMKILVALKGFIFISWITPFFLWDQYSLSTL